MGNFAVNWVKRSASLIHIGIYEKGAALRTDFSDHQFSKLYFWTALCKCKRANFVECCKKQQKEKKIRNFVSTSRLCCEEVVAKKPFKLQELHSIGVSQFIISSIEVTHVYWVCFGVLDGSMWCVLYWRSLRFAFCISEIGGVLLDGC